ncbi:MAG: hypothetical protein QNJ62_06540 [Methyloceanibacter sp.]|nr:hypothetical protein [Methyloceanibacter sp.]
MIITRRLILAKLETTQGADPIADPANDSVRVENPSATWLDARFHQPVSVKPSLSSEQALYGGALRQYTFEVDLRGSGTAGTPPEVGALLRACGMGETIAASTSVTYAPVSTGFESVAIYFYEDGKLHKLLGGFGTVVFTAEVGKPIRAAFTFSGHSVDPVDAALAAPSFDAVSPPIFLGSAFTADAFAAKIGTLSLDMGVEISMPEDVASADGWGDLQIVGRTPNGSFNPLDTLVADYDWVTKWQANTLASIVSGNVGSTAGNIINLNIPQAQYRELAPADRNKIQSLEVAYDARENTGDDEMSLVFT